ncbi:MAG: hypothetical protein Q7J54_02690 [Candidatus Woesearchaeota archaeon]|nr:hypothetical protein [Candidatus Woesearchaeota archaeon]
MFERGSTRAVRRYYVKETQIHKRFLEAEAKGGMKQIIKLEHPLVKTLKKMIKKMYVCMHRQFILQYHLVLEINAVISALKGIVNSADQQSKRSINDGINQLKILNGYIINLLDKEINMIEREVKGGKIFLGVKNISAGGAFNEIIGLLRTEGGQAKKAQAFVNKIRALAASVKAVTTTKKFEQLKRNMNDLKPFIESEERIMKVLFYDQVTLIGYTNKDIDEFVNLFYKLNKEGFPPVFVQNFLKEISEKVKGEEERDLKELKSEAQYVESRAFR